MKLKNAISEKCIQILTPHFELLEDGFESQRKLLIEEMEAKDLRSY